MLEHGDTTKVSERIHVFMGIAELMLIALEDETEKFELVLEQMQDQNQLLGPNSSINKLTKRYMKLERVYLQQNKEYDCYAHTMHTHQFLTTHFFEVSNLAKDIKLKNDIDGLSKRQTNIELKIFDRTPPANQSNYFDKLTEDARKVITTREDIKQVRVLIKKKIEDFTVKMFGSQYPGVQPPVNPNV
jgi:hypothetical protein